MWIIASSLLLAIIGVVASQVGLTCLTARTLHATRTRLTGKASNSSTEDLPSSKPVLHSFGMPRGELA